MKIRLKQTNQNVSVKQQINVLLDNTTYIAQWSDGNLKGGSLLVGCMLNVLATC